VFENAIGGPSIRGLGDTASYLVEANHPQGELSTYIHGGSTDVYHEIQRQRPEALPVSGTAANETANLAVTVNTTTATGPMHVAVVRPTTETPADAVLAVDTPGFPDRIETGADGEAWLIQPEKPFTLSAAAGGDRVNVTVR
jgi:hypothetical protein